MQLIKIGDKDKATYNKEKSEPSLSDHKVVAALADCPVSQLSE